MPKNFYTEKDIEDMFKGGIMALEVNDNVVLTELAYEKAGRLGMKLILDRPGNPPSAPVRPYITQKRCKCAEAPAPGSAAPSSATCAGSSAAPKGEGSDLNHRIRDAVLARLGTQVDATLLDVIIKRVMNATGVK